MHQPPQPTRTHVAHRGNINLTKRRQRTEQRQRNTHLTRREISVEQFTVGLLLPNLPIQITVDAKCGFGLGGSNQGQPLPFALILPPSSFQPSLSPSLLSTFWSATSAVRHICCLYTLTTACLSHYTLASAAVSSLTSALPLQRQLRRTCRLSSRPASSSVFTVDKAHAHCLTGSCNGSTRTPFSCTPRCL